MKQRFITTIVLLLCVGVHVAAQALTDRYHKDRPIVVACDNDRYADVTMNVAREMGLPCVFVQMTHEEALEKLELGEVDVIITDARNFDDKSLYASKSIIDFSRVSGDTIAELRYVGKDRQLIEEMDDQYIRMRESGDVAEIEKRWEHPELMELNQQSMVLSIADALLILTAILFLLSLFVLWHVRGMRRHMSEVEEMMSQAKLMTQYYAIEDNQAAHDLLHKYEALLCNPFVAISFYDVNGQLLVENELMRRLRPEMTEAQRQPLYDSDGEVTCYLVAIACPQVAI